MNAPQTIDPRHGATSASNALADSLCAGRHLAQQGQPDSTSEYAESGNAIHKALADSGGKAVADLNLEQREVFNTCRQIESKIVAQYFGETIGGLRAFREQRYWAKFTANGAKLEHSGQADVVFRVGTRALINDYKTGRDEAPESPKNPQLRDLGCLVRGNLVPTDEVAVVIIQPFVTHTPTLCVYTKDDLDQASKEMFTRVIASNTPGAKRVAGEVQCQYCRAKKVCVAYQRWAGQITPPTMLTLLEVPMAAWTPQQCATAASALGPCLKFLEELKWMLKGKLEADPNAVPGWMLQPGAKRETIIDAQGVFERFAKLGGKIEQFMPAVGVVKGKLKVALHDLTGAKAKQLDAALDTLCEGLVQVSQNQPSLKMRDPEPPPRI